jgi:enoyl-CoA hydratase/carnithine racemase
MAITLEKDGPLALIKINRPPANSYDRTFMEELDHALEGIRTDGSLRAALLTSDVPRFFSAGADVKFFQQSRPEDRIAFVQRCHAILGQIERLLVPVIAVINGHCLGGGLEIALACDLRFAAEGEYRLGLPEVTLGLLPGNGGTQRLPRLIGTGRALDMMLTGETLTPQQAFDARLVERLYPPSELLTHARAYATQLADRAPLAVGHIKLATRLGAKVGLEEGLQIEREAVAKLFKSKDAEEGIAAFLEKRKPVFAGE